MRLGEGLSSICLEGAHFLFGFLVLVKQNWREHFYFCLGLLGVGKFRFWSMIFWREKGPYRTHPGGAQRRGRRLRARKRMADGLGAGR